MRTWTLLVYLTCIVVTPACRAHESPLPSSPEQSSPAESATPEAGSLERLPGESMQDYHVRVQRQKARRVPQQVEQQDNEAATDVDLPAGLRERLVADAARRAGVPETAVILRSAEAVSWPDGSLGCPKPGVMYTQMIVDGYRVVLEANGRPYDYRAPLNGDFQLCEPRMGVVEPPPPRESRK